jgi:hypothetical protein
MSPGGERGLLCLCAAAVCAKLAVAAGAPPWLLHLAVAAAAIDAVALAWRPRPGRWLDRPRLVLVLVALWYLPVVYARIGGDGYEYYSLLRSPLVDHDLDLANDLLGFDAGAPRLPNGQVTSRVQLGVALLWAPLVTATHAVVSVAARLGADIAPNGFSTIYQTAATTSTFLYGFAALLLIEGRLRVLYGAGVALLGVVALWLATPLFFYMVANPSMSHGVAVFASALLLVAWLRARADPRPGRWALVGAAGGLLCLIRAHYTPLLLLPAADLAFSRGERRLRSCALLMAPPVALGLLQLAVWYRLYGPGFLEAVTGMNLIHGFEGHLLDVLFSPRKGLFVWTPLYAVAALGWVGWLRRDRRFGVLLVAGFVMTAWLMSLFDDWWGSDSFGQRRMLGLTPFFALGLGEALDFFRRRPFVPAAAVVSMLVLWNQQFAYIYNSELIAPKNDAVRLDQLAAAQVEVLTRRVVRWSDVLPARVWTILYDNLKGIWIDEGYRSLNGRLYLGEEYPELPWLVGEGWFAPEVQDSALVRPSRGPRSLLRVPIRTVGDFRVTLRARLEVPALAADLHFASNGTEVGRGPIVAGWHDYVFLVPADTLWPGLNTFRLTYSATPRAAVAGYDGRNTVLSVEWMSFERQAAPVRTPAPATLSLADAAR